MKNEHISAKEPTALVKAKPKMTNLNNSSFNKGFRDTPRIKAEKTKPIPMPAPPKPNVEIPTPIFCEACNKKQK